MWPTAIAVGVRGSDDDEPAAAGDIRAMANAGTVMSPLMGLVSKPYGLHAPHSFRYGLHYSAPGGAQQL
jgi:fucose permease